MNILFICKHNRFRSKVAEAIFRKYNKKHNLKSRGIIKDIDVAKNVINIMKEKEMPLKDKISRKLKGKDIEWADLIIVVANDVNLKIKDKKVILWKISDISQNHIIGIRKRVNIIKKKIDLLLNSLT